MTIRDIMSSMGLLALRLTAGLPMILLHGQEKLRNYSTMSQEFPDPLGIGSGYSLMLAIFGELFCAAAVVLGLFTRLAAIPPLITMFVAAFLVHKPASMASFKEAEMALLYLGMYAALFWLGGGSISLDALFFKKKPADG